MNYLEPIRNSNDASTRRFIPDRSPSDHYYSRTLLLFNIYAGKSLALARPRHFSCINQRLLRRDLDLARCAGTAPSSECSFARWIKAESISVPNTLRTSSIVRALSSRDNPARFCRRNREKRKRIASDRAGMKHHLSLHVRVLPERSTSYRLPDEASCERILASFRWIFDDCCETIGYLLPCRIRFRMFERDRADASGRLRRKRERKKV